jgi:threonine aldolase
MRAAMAAAEVGDDVYGEDPTINRLEARAAEIFEKEAAVFVPTGTMGNNIAIKLHTNHGEEVICEARCHLMDWELSMMAWFAGCLARPVSSPNGILTWKQIQAALRVASPHNAPTTLISLENTHNMAGGTVYPLETIDEICHEAHARDLKVHVDGARIFNASVATHTPVARIVRDVDSVMFCLSKGLGAPVGSMVVGTRDAIARGRLYRKRLGGAMRQAGVLAAGGLIALEKSPSRLHEDHANAAALAHALTSVDGISIDLGRVETNIVIFDVSNLKISAPDFAGELKSRGVLANAINAVQVRMLTHLDVTRQGCLKAAEIVAALASELNKSGVQGTPALAHS